MWRPFACNFVNHAFDNFLKRPAQTTDSKKAIRPQNAGSLFPFNLKQDAEAREAKFKQLSKQIKRQRLLIKQRDRLHEQKQRLEADKKKRAQIELFEKKKNYYRKIRSMTSNRSTRYTPTNRQTYRATEVETTIFSLTAAEETSNHKQTYSAKSASVKQKLKPPPAKQQSKRRFLLPEISRFKKHKYSNL